jgi:Arc/MetJ-type ribon-helix-helix transcriptional regulator
MTLGMTASKIAVSLPPELLRRVQARVRRGAATSVSAYVAAALEEKARLDSLQDLLTELLAESGGPLTAAERRAADRELDRVLGPGHVEQRRRSSPRGVRRGSDRAGSRTTRSVRSAR